MRTLTASSALKASLCILAVGSCLAAAAEPVRYEVDPSHTYPSFEADHMGISVWRGKFNSTKGEVTLDRATNSGTINVAIDIDSVDYGHEAMNKMAKSAELFNVAKFPKAVYKGKLEGFVNGAPTQASGELTLHGVTKPVALKINAFKCVPHPMYGREVCGADATATIHRDEFGIDAGQSYGFRMDVTLRIQVEALAVVVEPAAR